jgi:hypothetical protein
VAGVVSILVNNIGDPSDVSLATIPVPAFSGPFYRLKAAEERGEYIAKSIQSQQHGLTPC